MLTKILIPLAFVLGFTMEANAQFNPLKALEDVVEKAVEAPKQQSRRADPLRGAANPTQTNEFNCEGDWNLRYSANKEGGTSSSASFCVPSKSYIDNNDLIFDIKGFKIPHQEFVNWDACEISASNTNNITHKGIIVGASTILYCQIEPDTVSRITLIANNDMYYISHMEMMVCGPTTNQSGSEWDKRIKSKYQGIIDEPGRGRSRVLKYNYFIERTGEMGNRLEALTIKTVDTRYNPPTLSLYKQCNNNTMHWSFKIEMDRKVEQAFKNIMVQSVEENQSAGEDF